MGRQFNNNKKNVRVANESTNRVKGNKFPPDARKKTAPTTFKAKFKNNQPRHDQPESNRGEFFIKPENAKPSTSSEDKSRRESPRKVFSETPSNDRRGQAFGKRKSTLPETSGQGPPKKVFDKKLWRLHRYSNKYKLEQWEGKRKKQILNEYYKQVKDDRPKFDVQKIYDEDCEDEENDNENNLNVDITEGVNKSPAIDKPLANKSPHVDKSCAKDEQQHGLSLKKTKKKAFMKAHMEYDRVKTEKQLKKEEYERKKAEREAAMKEYRTKKAEKYKKLSKRTKKGQPIMKDRMEMLLEQIENSLRQT